MQPTADATAYIKKKIFTLSSFKKNSFVFIYLRFRFFYKKKEEKEEEETK